jgi:hypothetical protein
MASSPRKVAKAVIRMKWSEPESDPKVIKILKDTALNCPVALSLSDQLEQEVIFDF